MNVRYICVMGDGGHSYWRGARCPHCRLRIRFREDAVLTARESDEEIDTMEDAVAMTDAQMERMRKGEKPNE